MCLWCSSAGAVGVLDTAPTCFPGGSAHHCVCSTENFKLWSLLVFLLNKRWLAWEEKHWMLGSLSLLHPRLTNGRRWCRQSITTASAVHTMLCATSHFWRPDGLPQALQVKHFASKCSFREFPTIQKHSQLWTGSARSRSSSSPHFRAGGGRCSWEVTAHLFEENIKQNDGKRHPETEPHLTDQPTVCWSGGAVGWTGVSTGQGRAGGEQWYHTTASRAGLRFGAGLLLLVGWHVFPPSTNGSFSGWARAARGSAVPHIWGPQRPRN